MTFVDFRPRFGALGLLLLGCIAPGMASATSDLPPQQIEAGTVTDTGTCFKGSFQVASKFVADNYGNFTRTGLSGTVQPTGDFVGAGGGRFLTNGSATDLQGNPIGTWTGTITSYSKGFYHIDLVVTQTPSKCRITILGYVIPVPAGL